MEDGEVGQPQGEVELVGRRPTVVTALPLKREARERLSRLLGARVLDPRDPCDDPDVVLTPSCSPQLIQRLKDRYNGARVVVVELDDWQQGIRLGGPVKRLVDAGADAYLLADSLDELADKLRSGASTARAGAPLTPAELTADATVDEVIAAFLRESVEYSVRVHGTPADREAPPKR